MEGLLNEIESYWSTRTEGYTEVNEKEWNGPQKQAWLSLLEGEFPDVEKEKLRILDIGTGPGFFPVILAEAGYHVDAVDYTQGMLDKAKENAARLLGSKKDNIRFSRMDAQNLDFEDQTFDVVISRNLTWNLERPQEAYGEWKRVVKKGGRILNFDANWYGYLYDEKMKEAYDQDRENVEKNHMDDHYLCTDTSRMEKIALQIPLSAVHRPEWDIELLENMGFCTVAADEDVWERVWSEEEKVNYFSTPMFMIKAIR